MRLSKKAIRLSLSKMPKEIKIKPIGIICTPYKEPKGMPIQRKFEKGVTGTIEIFPQYQTGLKDIEGFSHLILLHYFNRSKEERLIGKPLLEDEEHGIFAIRLSHCFLLCFLSSFLLEQRFFIITLTGIFTLTAPFVFGYLQSALLLFYASLFASDFSWIIPSCFFMITPLFSFPSLSM